MKRSIYVFAVILAFVLSMSTIANAKPGKPAPKHGQALPINAGVVYLVIAGLAVGVYAVNKSRAIKAGVINA